eukprot:104181-Pleurochrysis_carterae.AAC.2
MASEGFGEEGAPLDLHDSDDAGGDERSDERAGDEERAERVVGALARARADLLHAPEEDAVGVPHEADRDDGQRDARNQHHRRRARARRRQHHADGCKRQTCVQPCTNRHDGTCNFLFRRAGELVVLACMAVGCVHVCVACAINSAYMHICVLMYHEQEWCFELVAVYNAHMYNAHILKVYKNSHKQQEL